MEEAGGKRAFLTVNGCMLKEVSDFQVLNTHLFLMEGGGGGAENPIEGCRI